MQYRIKFKQAQKANRFKIFMDNCKKGIINAFNSLKSFTTNQIHKVKSFNDRTNHGLILNRLGILLLVVIPLFIVLIPVLYSLFWVIGNICLLCGTKADVLSIIAPTFDSVCFNIIVIPLNIFCLYAVIEAALDNLNADLNSVKSFLVHCILPLILSGLFYFVLLYTPAYNWTIVACGYIMKTILVLFVLHIITSIASGSQPEYDVYQILIPRK